MEVLISFFKFIGILVLVLMVFNIMIVVHEWGHFLAGRWRKLYIDRFQIWFGKPIWKKKINGVQYGLGVIPAGGFVSLPQMAPMEAIEGLPEEEKEHIKNLPPIKPLDKIIVAAAGPIFSFGLAILCALIVYAVKKPVNESVATTTIGIVAKDSPADKAGLKPGDKIISIDDKKVEKFGGMGNSIIWLIISSKKERIKINLIRPNQGNITLNVDKVSKEIINKSISKEQSIFKRVWGFVSKRPPLPSIGIYPQTSPVINSVLKNSPADIANLKPSDVIKTINGKAVSSPREVGDHKWEKGKSVKLGITRGSKNKEINITPRIPEINGKKPMIGIIWDNGGIRSLIRENPIIQVKNSVKSIVSTLGALLSRESKVTVSHLSGPVGIMGLYYDLFQDPQGWRLALWFSVVLNINLAIFNLLPFPVLDGGHIVTSIIEWIRNKPIHTKSLEIVQSGFVLILLSFMVFVTFKDIGDRVSNKHSSKDLKNSDIPSFLPLKKN